MADDLATSLVKQRESYRSKPYWDVNHWRVGYGSDTTTDADGNVHTVTRDTVTTRADANRDLARRIPAFQQHAAALIGQDAWNALPEGSRAALTSVAYNYGSLSHLPSIVSAARSGNPQAISQAILARANDNGGVNAQRRQQEAGVVLGHPIPLGTIPDQGVAAAGNVAKGTNFAVAGAPLPKPPLLAPPPLPRARPDPAALKPSSIYQQMPQDASYGIQQRLVPGQKTAVPTDFQALMPLGHPDARALSLTQPFSAPFVSEDHPKSNAVSLPPVNKSPSLPPMSVPNPAGIRSIEINPNGTPKVPGSIQTSSPLAGNVQMDAPRPPSIPVPPSSLHLLGQPGAVAPAAPATPQTVLNPAYTAALKAGQAYTAGGNIVTQAQQNAFGGLSVPTAPPKTLPPKYIAVPAPHVPVPSPTSRPLTSFNTVNPASQIIPRAGAYYNTTPAGHLTQLFTGQPIQGGLLGMLFGNSTPMAGLFGGGPAAPSSPPPGANFLAERGVNTQGLTIGQQANELNKQLAGSSRNADGSRGFGV